MVGKVMSAADAVEIVQSGDTIASNGYAGCGTPEALLLALGERFLDTVRFPKSGDLPWAGPAPEPVTISDLDNIHEQWLAGLLPHKVR